MKYMIFSLFKKSFLSKNSFFIVCIIFLLSCSQDFTTHNTLEDEQQILLEVLENEELGTESTFAVINKIATIYQRQKKDAELILFLTDYVENNPDDRYNAYWLLMTAHTYMHQGAEPIAEYYFDRIIQNYKDLSVNGKSIHIVCLQNLIQISKSPANRIYYFTKLIDEYSSEVNITEMYVRLAAEYEKIGDWHQSLATYELFLAQPDAPTIQVAGIPDAYSYARKLINFNDSAKDWTFESLEALERAVKSAIARYNFNLLDKYKSKVNFFAMSWRQDETQENSLENFSMRDYGLGNRIRYSAKLDESSNPNEAYLRTTGWSQYIYVWYLYFRKVNFPADPNIHGRWEWAGIYFGEKL